MQRPIFSTLEAQNGLEFCVLIRWADGAERFVRHFAQRQTAERWIANESENWLQQRLGQRDLPHAPGAPTSIASAAPEREDREQTMLALAA